MSKMSNKPIVRYVRILVYHNDIPQWFTSTLCVREKGRIRSAELTNSEVEAKREEAARIYGSADIADSGATSLQDAELYFNSMGLKNADNLTSSMR